MQTLSRWVIRHPLRAVAAWAVLAATLVALATSIGGTYSDSFELPDTDSSQAQAVLTRSFPAASGSTATIAFAPTSGTVDDPAVRDRITTLVGEIRSIGAVNGVASPYDPRGAAQISADHTVAYATVQFAAEAQDVPRDDVIRLVDAVRSVDSDAVDIGISGQVVQFATQEEPSSEVIGVLAAIVILLIAFGSLVAAGLPIVTALVGVGTGLMAATIAARWTEIATFAPTLAAMIGLGVGVDYALFILNRYRQAVDAGRDSRSATYEASTTAGRAVLVAGCTVIIALLGLFLLGIGFTNGLAIAASVTVLLVMLSALVLLPALLRLLGTRSFAVRMPWARRRTDRAADLDTGGFSRYAGALQRRPGWVVAVALLMIGVLATPMLSLRLGSADDSGKPVGSTERTAYDLLARGFGKGFTGPLLVVASLEKPGELTPVRQLAERIAADSGVAATSPVLPNEGGDAALVTVYPRSGPQDEATADLLDRIRERTIPDALAGTGVSAYVGGQTAVITDFGQVLSDALPLFLTLVIGLGVLMLLLLFRSVVIPLTAAATSLLSYAAALGAIVSVFQWGWLNDLLGVSGTGPIEPFLPVMLFAILFGLSMDYQVFLVSRMQEEWHGAAAGDNRTAVRRGLAGSGRVVVIAGAIMSAVFVSFVFGDDRTIKMFGLALAVAVIVDAFLVRLVLVPALMTLLGRTNWWLPGPLRRILPNVSVEGEWTAERPTADPKTSPADDPAATSHPVSG
jgi:RND superfamily putative drug exporter